jgi:hypothetical protein
MVDPQTGLRLPLVHHLVQQRVLNFDPIVPLDMPPAERELEGPAGSDVNGQLSQATAHAGGEPN